MLTPSISQDDNIGINNTISELEPQRFLKNNSGVKNKERNRIILGLKWARKPEFRLGANSSDIDIARKDI